MSAVPAARFLAEFGAEAVAAAPPGAEPDASRSACTAAELEEAFARGVEEGRRPRRPSATCSSRSSVANSRQSWRQTGRNG